MPLLIDRRTILAAPFFIRNLISAPPSGQVRLASFGAGGMAFVTLDVLARNPKIKVACVAEVDSAKLDQLKAKYPETRVHQDWRVMLAKERRNIDAVCVGTPDHMHAPMAMSAMRLGLPVYQQKPMAHSIYEIRQLTAFARQKNLITQMGIQIHSSKEYRSAIEVIRGGAIGKVKEVHSFSEKKWGDPDPLPDRSDPVPATLNWDHWIGVAQPRPFISELFHPVNWRKRIDFGTATFGDMGCHILDPVFGALGLSAPLSVRSEGPAPNRESWALDSVIHYVFPATPYTEGKTVSLTWYDGDARPPQEVQALIGERKLPGQGSLFIGTKGMLLLPHVAMPILLPEDAVSRLRNAQPGSGEPLRPVHECRARHRQDVRRLRLFGTAHGGCPPRTARDAFPESHTRMGLGQDEVHQHVRSESVHSDFLSSRMEGKRLSVNSKKAAWDNPTRDLPWPPMNPRFTTLTYSGMITFDAVPRNGVTV